MMQIGGKEVTKIMVGRNVIYSRPNYSSLWFECPDNGEKYTDFIGQTIMKWDKSTSVAEFRSSSECLLNASSVNAEPRLAITLPDGFTFSKDNPQTLQVYGQSLVTTTAPATYEDNQLSVSFGNPAQAIRAFALSGVILQTSDGLFPTFSLKVIRSDK